MDLKEIPYTKLSKKEKTVEKGKDVNKEKHFIIKESKIGREAEIISSTINSIYEISSKMKDIELVITKISNNSRRISNISDIINDISTQTHILALNASIESARVGKQGDGFSVIANEIKNLAKRSEISARDIENIMEAIRQDSSKAIVIANEVRVDEGIMILKNTGQAFEKTINCINDLEEKIKNIDKELKTELSEYLTIAVGNIINITKQVTSSLKKEKSSPLIIKSLNKINIIKDQVVNTIHEVESNHLNTCNKKIADTLKKQANDLSKINIQETSIF